MMEQKKWQGIGASSGYAAGRTWSLAAAENQPEENQPENVDIENELVRLQKAIKLTNEALLQYEKQVQAEKGEAIAQIFVAHQLLLQDPAFSGEMVSRIKEKGMPVKDAVKEVTDETVAMLGSLDDPYFRERAVDVKDVAGQLLQNIDGNKQAAPAFPESGQWIVVAEELTPAQTISLPKDRVLAFVVRKGGKTSHAAILARTYAIPAVVGLGAAWAEFAGAEALELDGDQGWVRALSADELTAVRRAAKQEEREVPPQEQDFAAEDGKITLAANIGGPADIQLVKRFQAQGIGLYRTEFLFMGEALPTADEQVAAYSEVIRECAPHLTVIRTLDIGGDKRAPALKLPKESNPFLGVRALRLCFKNPAIFETQLQAIWRASAAGPTAVMFPMITSLEELLKAKQFLADARQAVIGNGFAAGDLRVGMMIEVPAAAYIAPKLAKEVDFFSIGTNDLTQYALAVDRENEEVADLYQPYHPAVLGMIAQVARAAQRAGIWTGICGEAAGDSVLTPFFAGIGINELSMSPGLLPKVRQVLRALDQAAITEGNLVGRVLDAATAAEVTQLLKSYGAKVVL